MLIRIVKDTKSIFFLCGPLARPGAKMPWAYFSVKGGQYNVKLSEYILYTIDW